MKRAQRNRDAFWADKEHHAKTPQDRAAVAWDRLRAAVDDLPRDEHEGAWVTVVAELKRLRQSVTSGDGSHQFTSDSANRSKPYA